MRVAEERRRPGAYVVGVLTSNVYGAVLRRAVVEHDNLIGNLMHRAHGTVQHILDIVGDDTDGERLARALQSEFPLPVYLPNRLLVLSVRHHVPAVKRAVQLKLFKLGDCSNGEVLAVAE